jgi:tetratricopeptide (TPR) repeat protein
MTDVFQVQADIAGKVAGALDVTLGDTARRVLAAKPTTNLAAYDAYLQGMTVSNGAYDPPTIRRAIVLLEQAVALDSGLVAAWCELARNRSFLYGQGMPDPKLAAAALEATERTRALAPDSPEAAIAWRGYYANVLADPARALAAAEAGLANAPNNVDLLAAAAAAEVAVGRLELSAEHYGRVVALDPRSADYAMYHGSLLRRLHRYDEARAALDRALVLAPTSLGARENRAMVELEQGDLAAARRVMRAAPAGTDWAALAAYFATYQDLYWVLDDSLQALLLTLPPTAFDGDRGNWAIVMAQTYHLRGQQAPARAFADTAQHEFELQLKGAPKDAQRHALRGLALAYLGRRAEAIEFAKRGVTLVPSSDHSTGDYARHLLARTHLLLGEPEPALDLIEPLLQAKYVLTPGWLRIDPAFASLKGNPRFERLIATP